MADYRDYYGESLAESRAAKKWNSIKDIGFQPFADGYYGCMWCGNVVVYRHRHRMTCQTNDEYIQLYGQLVKVDQIDSAHNKEGEPIG